MNSSAPRAATCEGKASGMLPALETRSWRPFGISAGLWLLPAGTTMRPAMKGFERVGTHSQLQNCLSGCVPCLALSLETLRPCGAKLKVRPQLGPNLRDASGRRFALSGYALCPFGRNPSQGPERYFPASTPDHGDGLVNRRPAQPRTVSFPGIQKGQACGPKPMLRTRRQFSARAAFSLPSPGSTRQAHRLTRQAVGSQ